MKYLILLGPLLVGGCGIHQSSFDCQAKPGLGCRLISEVDQIITKGTLHAAIQKDHSQDARAQEAGKLWIAPFKDSEGHVEPEAFLALTSEGGIYV